MQAVQLKPEQFADLYEANTEVKEQRVNVGTMGFLKVIDKHGIEVLLVSDASGNYVKVTA